jgi:hypothetical protein
MLKVEYLGVIISKGQVQMDLVKVEGIMEWSNPQCKCVERDDTLRLLERAGNPMEVSTGNSVEIEPRELLRIQKILYTICER